MNTLVQMLRLHQWVKNLLVFIPLLAAHQLNNINSWRSLIISFFSFSLCASAVYITNDILDLESDQAHPRKRNRPFASGKVPTWVGVALVPLLLFISGALGTYVNKYFLFCLALYFLLSCAYSWQLKRLIIIDCITLAIFYTLRIVAGAQACSISLTFWLLAFSIFLFLSLSFLKRYAELEVLRISKTEKTKNRRGYELSDAPIIQTLGIAAGYASILMLSFYLNNKQVLMLYPTPEFVWASVPILLFWIAWMWIKAHRGQMHDDPLVFALTDKASLLAGFLFTVTLVLGTVFHNFSV